MGFTSETNSIEMLGSGIGISGGHEMMHAPQTYALRIVGSETLINRFIKPEFVTVQILPCARLSEMDQSSAENLY
jgi:hypothetical protein